MVGPFIFFDHMGPADFSKGGSFDVRPHPHIGLATVTYLFSGAALHRDSLGSQQLIVPGDVNWMIAGRGIVHSERMPETIRASSPRLHGIQCWVALPLEEEERAPSFEHHPAETLPVLTEGEAVIRVIAGTAYGLSAPTEVLSPTLYAHAWLPAGAELDVDDRHPERAAYVVDGVVAVDGHTYAGGTLLLLSSKSARLRAEQSANVMLLGGAPLAGTRHIFWNFVSSSEARIERAKDDWKNQRFPKVPGDELEFVPLPE
jgi:redox-sensitive bicupin YhaK (pirin superfamily)